MSFLRHEGIYRSDDFCVAGSEPLASLPALIGLDEFPAGYSLTGCSPAEPASASPTATDSQQSTLPYNAFSANGDNPLNLVSQPKGALHILPFPCTSSANGKGETRGKSVRDPPGLKCQECPRLFTTDLSKLRGARSLCDGHPAGFLLLPHGHHSYRGVRQRFPVSRAAHGDAVGDDEDIPVQFDLKISQGVIAQL
jgi:hypothetical protein